MIPYISDDDVLTDLGIDIAQAHYDRNRDGVPDAAVLWRVRCDATNRVRSQLGGVFPNLPLDTLLEVTEIDGASHRITVAEPHGFMSRSRVIFIGEDPLPGLETIIRLDGLYFARRVQDTSFEISNEPGGPRLELTSFAGPLPTVGIVPRIPDQVITLTRQAAVVEALRTIPKLNRLADWKTYDDALVKEFAKLTAGPATLDMNRTPTDPGENRKTMTIDGPSYLWGGIVPPRFPPSGMY